MTAQRAARRQKQQDLGDPGRMRCGSAQTSCHAATIVQQESSGRRSRPPPADVIQEKVVSAGQPMKFPDRVPTSRERPAVAGAGADDGMAGEPKSSSPAAERSRSAISDRVLRDLSRLERADVLRRIQMLTASELHARQRILIARRWSVRFLAACLLSVRALRVAARTARGLEPNAPIAPLWRTPLLTFPAPGQGAPLESRDPSSW